MLLRRLQFFIVLLVASCDASPTHHELSRLAASTSRLSGEVAPISYTLKLLVESDFPTTNKYSGTVTIVLNVTDISNKDSAFQFHAKELTLTSVSLTKGRTENFNISFTEADPETDLVTVIPTQNLTPGEDYNLVIEFVGTFSETSMVGFYKSTYIDDYKQTKYVLGTQFEEIHARKAFPCFDEPQLKAPFTITITYPKGYFARSNAFAHDARKYAQDDTLESVTFDKTPPMSTYLVAFMVAEFNCKNGGAINEKVNVQLCTRINAGDASAKVALDAAPHIIKTMSDFTQYNYTGINQLMLASIPDFAPGAMENWGFVNFREEDLLWTEGESSNYYKQKVVTVVAHELSHQWFGDLVTLKWWNEMFLNEGFATYFEYHAPDEQEDWQLPKQFVIEQLQSALDSDSYGTALPLTYDSSNADYSSRTNDVSYNKGGSILRMVQHFLTLDNFKLGLVDYINNNAQSTVTSDILWDSLQAYVDNLPAREQPPKNLGTIMENWTKQPGYPLLTVTASGNDVVISQEQFVVNGDDESTTWYVPITYTTSGKNITEFEKTSTQAWLTPAESLTLSEVLTNVNWIVLNNQQVGYYRVNYDDTLLTKISNTLNSNLDDIDEISRAHIIDDQFNLAKAGKKTYGTVLDFLSFLKNDISYYSWSSAFNGFEYLLTRTADADVRDALKSFIKTQMQKLYESVPMDQEKSNDHLYTLKQVLALKWACEVNDGDCTSTSRKMFLDYKDSSDNKPSPNLRSIVYCNGLRQSESFTEDFRFLWGKYQETKIATERVTILKALGCVKDTPTRTMYLNMALTEAEIRLQDARYVFQSVYSNDPEGVTDVLNFVIDNYQTINEHFGDTSTVISLIQTLGSRLSTEIQINKLNTFNAADDLDDNVRNAVTTALATAEQNLKVTKTLEEGLKGYLDLSSAGLSLGNNYLVNVICVLVGYALFTFF